MGKTVILSAIINPQADGQWTFHPNGVLVIKDGRIVSIGSVADCSATSGSDAEIVQLDGVIIPGFVDVHCHWVQHAVRGAYSGDLLHWLQNNIWPEEARYADETVARERAREFYRDMLRAGTVMGMSYSSVHRQATEIALDEMRGDWVVGNVLMAVNAPDALTQCSVHQESALREFARLKPQERYAVTPRFAHNMRDDDLAAAARVAREGDFLVQTHLAESQSEIAWVKELFPDAANYTNVYDRAGLLGTKSILGHCIEMSDAEWACLASRGSWVAHCPTSNEALGNTRMPLENCRNIVSPMHLHRISALGPAIACCMSFKDSWRCTTQLVYR